MGCRAARLSQRGCRMGVKAGLSGTQFLPLKRHAMDGVAGAQHQGWVVLQISCKALQLNALDGCYTNPHKHVI